MRLGGERVQLVRALEELAPGMAVYLYPCNVHDGRAERTIVKSIYQSDWIAGSGDGEFIDEAGTTTIADIEPIPEHEPWVVIGRQMVDKGYVWRVAEEDEDEDEIMERELERVR